MNLRFTVEVKGQGTSSYDEETIRRRLAVIEQDSEEALYLLALLETPGPIEPPSQSSE